MTISPLSWMRLEKAALDNGFDIEGARIDDWRAYSSSQTSLRIWLSEGMASNYLVALSRWDVWRSLDEVADDWKGPLPPGASGARQTSDQSTLHRMLRRSFQLSRILPDEPLQLFRQQTAPLPLTTEAERSVVQRIGQDIFRRGLLDYWEGRCAISGLAVAELLRASHIKPWAHCLTDAERLDVFNGLLLAPHLDALFDRGWMTLDLEGNVLLSTGLDSTARSALGVTERMRLHGLTDHHRLYLNWHRERIYRPLSPDGEG